jgi:tRNA(fMet)-specific endonuclease VapC
LATTTVNTFELYLGAYKSRDVRRGLTGVKGLVSTLEMLPLTEAAAERAGKILADLEKKGQAIDARDMFVGAITVEAGYALLTRNKEHFERIKDLQLMTEHHVSMFGTAKGSRLG